MFSARKVVKQENITALGDVTAGDKYEIYLPRPTQLDLFSNLYKKEVENKSCTNQLIDELTHYKNSKSDIRDLSTKLSEAGYSYLIKDAEDLKESVSKLIVKYQHYKSAQKIITYLLAEIESIFNSEIKPKIRNKCQDHELSLILRQSIENVLNEKLGENVLDIYSRQLRGMVYFLTGNCHLEWK
ncbi:hypothetical protein DBR44_17750 [Aquitalea sp. FJL05]|uniref:ABC-three component system protein n=1 Tax=Aquitalea TaxID=407217 RepID=UPI000F59DF3C|nr:MULTISPECIES: ABC-three component system protein [Aquitalea]RQO67131.1 hypothetical protein DBR44_17750 [Aquitalea sp. FJL05]